MKKGFVQMSLDLYDELLLENERMMDLLDNSVPLEEYNKLQELLDNIVKIETDWNDAPRLIVNIGLLADDLREKFEQSKHAYTWEMIDLSHEKETIWGVFKKKSQEAVEDQA